MLVKLAYLGVVLIWATTPLGIKWSGEGLHYMLGITARMAIGGVCLLLVMLLLRNPLKLHRAALHTYLAISVHLLPGMTLTYWSAQFIPSGWISVVFGLTPFMTALLAAVFLQEASLGWQKLLSYLLGMLGLAAMFFSALEINQQALFGILGVLLATFMQAASAVWVKSIDAGLTALQKITGGLLLSLPGYLVIWYLLTDGSLPTSIPDKAAYAIIYLGVIATTLGFICYYYILEHLSATKVALLTLMTPVIALLLGFVINHEALGIKVIAGTGLIITALALHQFSDRKQVKDAR